ncbi:MAG: putative molybdenum carrier protein, partial [Planctomycetota bacterium]
MHELSLDKVVSGGQTGVDRGALDAAIYLGLPHGGWCPRGRLAEDGVIPARYELQETTAPQYAVRTEKNVIDSDATLILHSGPLSGGTKYTRAMAEKHQRP